MFEENLKHSASVVENLRNQCNIHRLGKELKSLGHEEECYSCLQYKAENKPCVLEQALQFNTALSTLYVNNSDTSEDNAQGSLPF